MASNQAAISSSKGESKYERLRKIGIGSYGVVFKCVNRSTGQVVAIKRYSEDDSDPVIRKIAMREVRTLRQLQHPNLIHLIEVFRRRRRLHLVFDYCELTVLDVIEKYGNSCPVNLIKKIVWQIVNGINYCHANQCIHRDVKPENILINQAGVVKLCDFGFARRLSSSASPSTGTAVGHQYSSQAAKRRLIEAAQPPAPPPNAEQVKQERQALTDYVATRWYRAPELLIGEIYYDTKIDIWAIGCVTAELMRGKPIWPGKSDLDQLFMIVNSLGALTSDQQRTLLSQALYDQVHLEKLSQPPHKPAVGSGSPTRGQLEPLDRKLPGRMGASAFNFVSACLQMEPKMRPSSDDLLLHNFIHSARMAQFMAQASPHEATPVTPVAGGQHQLSVGPGSLAHRSNSQSLLLLAANQQQQQHQSTGNGPGDEALSVHSGEQVEPMVGQRAPAKSRLPVLSPRFKQPVGTQQPQVVSVTNQSRHRLPLTNQTNQRLESSSKRPARSVHPAPSVKFNHHITPVPYLPTIVDTSPKVHAHARHQRPRIAGSRLPTPLSKH